jgi:hypothetical protein
MNRKILFSILGLFCIPFVGLCQIPDDFNYNYYKELYPKRSFVYLDVLNERIIDLEDGELKVYSTYEEQLLCLEKNAIGVSQRSIGYNNFSEILELDATAYLPAGNRYKKYKVRSFADKEVITDDVSFYSGEREKEFEFEDLKEGAVTKITVKRLHKDPHLLGRYVFSRNIPLKQKIFSLKAHKQINMGIYESNIQDSLIHFEQYDEGEYKVYEWKMQDQDQLEVYGQERYNLHYEPHVVPYIKSYKLGDSTISFMRNADDLYRWYSSLISQVDLTANEEMTALANELTDSLSNQKEKVERVYQWVQANIKYIAFGDGYGGFIPRDPKLVYKRRFGDCKDMSSILISLLQSIGIKAHFTWVGTRIIPYQYTELATPVVDNHMIVTYFLRDSTYFLDATDKHLKFGWGGYNVQGKQVLISLDEANYKIDSIRILPAEANAEVDTAYMKIQDEKLTGTGNLMLTGYLAEEVYDRYEGRDEKKRKELIMYSFQKGSNKYKLLDYNLNYDKIGKDRLDIDYTFEIESYVKQFDDKTYINMNLTKQIKDYKIDESQNVPRFFDYKNLINKHYILDLGDQLEVLSVPENQSVENDLAKFSVSYEQKGKALHYKLFFKQKITQLEKADFKEWNKTIEELSKALNESVTLKNNTLK